MAAANRLPAQRFWDGIDRLLGVAQAFGPQQDDRTRLLVRARAA